MKKSILSKIIVLIIVLGLMACMTTTVFADDVIDITNSLNGGLNTPTETEDEPEPEPETTPPANNISTYETSNPKEDIPYAGPEDTILMVSAFIVFGIIGVYTFIKMSDYSNI